MPGPAVYVVAVVGGVAAVIAFKQFVYDPHLAPRIRAWREVRAAQQQERRRRRELVPVSANRNTDNRPRDLKRKEKHSGDDDHNDSPHAPVELDTLFYREIEQWRNTSSSSTLRHRHPTDVIDESNLPLAYPLIAPSFDSPNRRVVSPTHTLGSSPQLGSTSSPGNFTQRSPLVPALPITNLNSFPSDVDMTASIYQTPSEQVMNLPSNTSSPQIVVLSPFSDPVALSPTQSRRSDMHFMSPSQSEMDDVLSFRSSMSSPLSSSIDSVLGDDSDLDNSHLGSDDSWAEVRGNHN